MINSLLSLGLQRNDSTLNIYEKHFKLHKKRIDIVDLDRCMECGACMMNCRSDAINVKAGVGCAAAVITGFFNKSEPTRGCSATCG